MKKRIGISTKNEVLYEKLRLLTRHVCEVVRVKTKEDAALLSLVFVDTDTSNPIVGVRCITMSSNGECDLKLPFRHEDVLSLISESDRESEYIELSEDGKHVYFCNEAIKLTDIEFKLISTLMESDGMFVSRDTLLNKIWGEGVDSGVVNVYIHYLRQKLEKGGHKVILSSRKEGYGIDKKYRR